MFVYLFMVGRADHLDELARSDTGRPTRSCLGAHSPWLQVDGWGGGIKNRWH
jgi:hypothetical protein